MAGRPKGDAFEKWQKTGKWPKVREEISTLYKKGYTQRHISERLHLNEATFSRLKAEHPEIAEIFNEIMDEELPEAMAELKRQAFGYWVTEDTKEIATKGKSESGKKGRARKIWIPGNYKALDHYMTLRFGKEYMSSYTAMQVMKELKEEMKENWDRGNEDRL